MPERSKRRARGEQTAGFRSERGNLYDEVTSRIIAEMEAGRLPWVQPWSNIADGPRLGLPRNGLTGRAYSGINVLILWGEVIARAYPTQSWLTFRQALDAGGCVRKGERATTIVYADRFVPKDKPERAARDGDETRSIPFLKRFSVFNVAQCEGLRADFKTEPTPLPEPVIAPVADALIAASGADIRIGGDKAFYAPSADFVRLPPPQAFFDPINFYRTALHEMTHWTGAASRLARDFSGSFGSEKYAREELVAEMGSAFLCAALGIVPTVRHADYLATWLDVLRGDNRAIFRAASAASKAADYLLAFHAGAAPTDSVMMEPAERSVTSDSATMAGERIA